VLRRISMRSLYRAWRAWLTSTDSIVVDAHETRRAELIVATFAKRMSNLTLLRAWSGWKQKIGDLKANRRLMHVAVTTWHKRSMLVMFRLWSEMVRARHTGRQIVDRVLCRISMQSLYRAWRSWLACTDASIVLQKYAQRISHLTLAQALDGWRRAVRDAKSNRHIVSTAVQRWCHLETKAVFARWTSLVADRVFCRTVFRRIESQRVRRTVAATVAWWRAVTMLDAAIAVSGGGSGGGGGGAIQARRVSIGKVIRRLAEGYKRQAVNQWQNIIRAALHRCAHRDAIIVRALTRKREGYRRQAIHHWRAALQRGVRRDVNIVRALTKKRDGYRRQAIHHWRAALRRGVRRGVIIARTLSKRLHLYLRLAWSQWSLHVLRHSHAGFRRLGTCRDVWVPPDEDQHHLIAPLEWEEHERGASGDAGEFKGDQTTTLRAWWTAWSAARRVAKVHGWLWKAKGKMVRVGGKIVLARQVLGVIISVVDFLYILLPCAHVNLLL
jgi:hypothetical protein